MNTLFITGTDTDAGKTFVSCLLLKQLNKAGYKTSALKPIASGCHYNEKGELQNDDALQLQQAASVDNPYSMVNPFTFEPPVAPHLVAKKSGRPLSVAALKKTIQTSLRSDVDINLIEGVGGWLVPLNAHELLADLASTLDIPIILVVGIKLGCLNHALLTYQNILSRKVKLIGWIANCLSPDTLLIDENIATLKTWIKHPCLGTINFNQPSIDAINIDIVMQKNSNSSCPMYST